MNKRVVLFLLSVGFLPIRAHASDTQDFPNTYEADRVFARSVSVLLSNLPITPADIARANRGHFGYVQIISYQNGFKAVIDLIHVVGEHSYLVIRCVPQPDDSFKLTVRYGRFSVARLWASQTVHALSEFFTFDREPDGEEIPAPDSDSDSDDDTVEAGDERRDLIIELTNMRLIER